jgi:hypothetical protein
MSGIATAIVVTGVVGAGASYAASKSASNKASKASKYAADAASQVQWDMYDQTREDFSKFAEPANRSLATLQSALYGGDFEYDDPSTTALSPEELAAENWKAISADRGTYDHADFWKDVGHGEDPIGRLARGNNWLGPYNGVDQWYRGADGKLTTTAPKKLTATFKPVESEGFKYTKARTIEDLGRSLRMMGRGSGTVAANSMGRTLGDLNAANEDKQYGRAVDMVKIGQNAAGTIASAGQNTANNVSANTMAAGNNLATIALNNGQTQANLWSGLGGTATNAYGTYQMGQYLNKPAPAAH